MKKMRHWMALLLAMALCAALFSAAAFAQEAEPSASPAPVEASPGPAPVEASPGPAPVEASPLPDPVEPEVTPVCILPPPITPIPEPEITPAEPDFSPAPWVPSTPAPGTTPPPTVPDPAPALIPVPVDPSETPDVPDRFDIPDEAVPAIPFFSVNRRVSGDPVYEIVLPTLSEVELVGVNIASSGAALYDDNGDLAACLGMGTDAAGGSRTIRWSVEPGREYWLCITEPGECWFTIYQGVSLEAFVSGYSDEAIGRYIFASCDKDGDLFLNENELAAAAAMDVSGNGTVDTGDAALILRAAGTGALPDADLNGDGVTDAFDAALLLQRFVGLITAWR